MIVLSEARIGPPKTSSERDNQAMSQAAQTVGCRIYYIPSNFDECETADNALSHIPKQESEIPTIWLGFIPPEDRYDAIYEAAQSKNLRLLNSPEEHRNALEFARTYPLISDLTPETIILGKPSGWKEAAAQLGYPVFVRGSVRSRKGAG